MATLLKIEVSPRGDYSISRQLGKQFTETWLSTHSGGKVVERDLSKTDLPFIELPWIMGAYSDPSTHDANQKAALAIGNELIAELMAADEWLITTPMYNFAVPARLKAFIDHIVRVGVTFQANADGSYTGLVPNRKVTIIIASAGSYGPGSPAEGYDAEKSYLRSILGFIGISDVHFVQAGSTWKVDRGVETRDAFLAPFAGEVEAAAK